MPKLEFAEAAHAQVVALAPADLLSREWLPQWIGALQGLALVGAHSDAISLGCARLELLGALHAGETGDTKSLHFVSFCDRFLVPVNARWKDVHNLSGGGHSASEFHNSFRIRALTGGAPPPHAFARKEASVLGFSVGADAAHASNHLRIVQDRFHVHAGAFLSELVQGVSAYAACLREDRELLPPMTLKPVERFRRGYWWRLRPSGLATKIWATEGSARGIPAP